MSLEQKARIFLVNLEQIQAKIRQMETACNLLLQKPSLDGVVVEWTQVNKQKFITFVLAKKAELDTLITELIPVEP